MLLWHSLPLHAKLLLFLLSKPPATQQIQHSYLFLLHLTRHLHLTPYISTYHIYPASFPRTLSLAIHLPYLSSWQSPILKTIHYRSILFHNPQSVYLHMHVSHRGTLEAVTVLLVLNSTIQNPGHVRPHTRNFLCKLHF